MLLALSKSLCSLASPCVCCSSLKERHLCMQHLYTLQHWRLLQR